MKVLLADDHRLMREGLRSLLEDEPDIDVVGEVADGNDTVEAVRRHSPDVVVMDVSMPGLNGIDATRRVVESFPDVRVLCLSMYADLRTVSAVLRAGAAGYMVKESSPEELVSALGVVASDRTYLSPAIAGAVIEDYVTRLSNEESPSEPRLTNREREILQLIAEGYGTKAIAARLGISAKTVATHREHITAKLGIYSIVALTKYSIRERLTTVDHVATT